MRDAWRRMRDAVTGRCGRMRGGGGGHVVLDLRHYTHVMRAASDGRQVESMVLRCSSDRLPVLPFVPASAPAAVRLRRHPVARHDLRTHPARGTGDLLRGYGKAAVGAPVLAVGGSLELGHQDD